MSQDVVIRYRAEVQDAERATEQLSDSVEQVGQKSEESGKKGDKAFKDTGKSAMSLRNGLIDLSNVAEGVLPIGHFQQGIRTMRTFSGVVGVASGAVKTKSIALKGLRVALIATGIGAIVVLLGSLVAWLQRSTEGADFLARATAAVGEVVDSVMGVLSSFGSLLVNVWSNPRKAISDFRGDMDGVVGSIGDAVREAATLAQMTRELDREMNAFAVTQSELNLEIAKAMDMARDETVAIEDRNKAIERAAELKEKEMQESEAFAKRRLEIAKRDAEINDNEDKQREALEQAEIEYNQTLERNFNERRRLRRFEMTLSREAEREEKERHEAEKEREKEKEEAAQARRERIEEIRERNEAAEIKMMQIHAESLDDFIAIENKKREIALRNNDLTGRERELIELETNNKIEELRASHQEKLSQQQSDAIEKIREDESKSVEERVGALDDLSKRVMQNEELTQEQRAEIKKQAQSEIEGLIAEEEAAELERMDRILEAELELAGLRAQTVDEQIRHERDKKQAGLEEIARMEEAAREQGIEDLREFNLRREILEEETEQRIRDLQREAHEERLQERERELGEYKRIGNEAFNTTLDLLDRETQAHLAQLESRLENEDITQDQFDDLRAKAAAEQAQRARRLAIFEAIINAARAVAQALPNIPLSIAVGALGALQIAKVASEPVPTFSKGEIGIEGPGNSTSDSIPARLSKGESVITAAGTRRNRKILQDINRGKQLTYIDPRSGGAAMNKSDGARAVQGAFNDEGIRHEIRKSVEQQLNSQSAFARMVAKETGREIARNNKYK